VRESHRAARIEAGKNRARGGPEDAAQFLPAFNTFGPEGDSCSPERRNDAFGLNAVPGMSFVNQPDCVRLIHHTIGIFFMRAWARRVWRKSAR